MSQDRNIAPVPAPPQAAPARIPEAAPGVRPHPRRVMLACAEPVLGDTIERVLRHHVEDLAPEGLEIRRVHDGVTCLQDIQLIRPSLLILHSRLDRMAPDEILRAWDAAHPGDDLPAIVLSSGFGRDLPAGMPGAVVVQLPFANSEFIAVVARALEVPSGA